MKLKFMLGALVLCFSAPDYATATQSDLVKVCVDSRGRLTPVRFIAGRQTCGRLKTIFLDRPGYSPRDFAGVASDELGDCTVLDVFPDDITLCLGFDEIVPPPDTDPSFVVCRVWLDGAEEYLAAGHATAGNEGVPGGFIFTPEGSNIFAYTREATLSTDGAIRRNITFFHPETGYVIEVDLTLLIWPIDGDCHAIGRASNAPLSSRD